MSSYEELKKHIGQRQEAIGIFRDSDDPATQSKAWDAAEEARTAIDLGLLAKIKEQEDAETRRKAEMVAYATAALNVPNPVAEQRKAVREFMTPGSARSTLKIPLPSPEARATTDIVTTDAGTTYASYVVPTSIFDRVIYHANAVSGVLKTNVTTLYTAGGNTMYIPTLTTDPVAALHGEGAAATQNDFVLAHPELGSYRVDGWFGVSKEFLDDAMIDVEAFLGDLGGRAIATQIAAYAATGTGSSQPQGINDATKIVTTAVTAASATTFTMDELIGVRYAPLPEYQARGQWVVGDAAFLIIARAKGDDGQYYFQPSVVAGTPDKLFGKDIFTDAGFEACTTGLDPVFFGDFSNYWTRWSHGGIEFTRDDSFAFTSFEVTFRYAAWWDAELLHPTLSVQCLTMG